MSIRFSSLGLVYNVPFRSAVIQLRRPRREHDVEPDRSLFRIAPDLGRITGGPEVIPWCCSAGELCARLRRPKRWEFTSLSKLRRSLRGPSVSRPDHESNEQPDAESSASIQIRRVYDPHRDCSNSSYNFGFGRVENVSHWLARLWAWNKRQSAAI